MLPVSANLAILGGIGRREGNLSARYYSPDDPEAYLTPSQLKRLGRKKQVRYLVHWFHGMFEDPQNETPYAIDKESPYNYEYIWGGPFDARDELGDEFSGIVSEDVIEEAIGEVESEGTVEWAPGPNHPEKRRLHEEAMAESYDPPHPRLDDIRQRLDGTLASRFGDPFELEQRVSLRAEIAELRSLLREQNLAHGRIGHNGPPEHLALSVEEAQEVSAAVDQIDMELAKELPDLQVVAKSAGRLEVLIGWIGRKLDKSVDGFMTSIGAAGGVAVVASMAGIPILEKIGQVFNSIVRWLDSVTLPF